MVRIARALIGIALACLVASAAQAQDYPSKPIRLVLPSGPGGALDAVARLYASSLRSRLGQPTVVEPRAGGGGLVGVQHVARSPADGYTLLFAASIASFNVFTRDPGVNVATDMEFISFIMRAPQLVAVNAARPYKTFADLAAYGKANPGKLNFASYGQALWLMTEMLNGALGVQGTHIPFTNSPQAAQAVAAGDVDYLLASWAPIRPLLEAGKLRALAVTANQRSPYLPNVPSMAEAGVKLPDIMVWMGVFAPRGTPRPIVDKLNAEARVFVKEAEVAKKLEAFGFEPYASTPEEFRAAFVREETKFLEVAKLLGIKPE